MLHVDCLHLLQSSEDQDDNHHQIQDWQTENSLAVKNIILKAITVHASLTCYPVHETGND